MWPQVFANLLLKYTRSEWHLYISVSSCPKSNPIQKKILLREQSRYSFGRAAKKWKFVGCDAME
jgi:hypothetical protein